ncbi:MAG: mechanosensitive ion channel [Candidatus Thiodiazotropha sp.]
MEQYTSELGHLLLSKINSVYTVFDYFVLGVNALIFLFSSKIISKLGYSQSDRRYNASVWMLRIVNLTLFILYFLAVFFIDKARPLSITGLTLLCSYLLAHLFQLHALKRYGRTRKIAGSEALSHTYQSEVIGLIGWAVAALISFLIIINVWDMTSWLHTTSVLGAVVLIVYSTKDVWAPDNINGLILLYNNDVEPGSVVQVKEIDLLAVVVRTSLTQTVFRDLRRKYKILLPNSRFRACKVEILTSDSNDNLDCFVDFKIGYAYSGEEIESFLTQVWQQVADDNTLINVERAPKVRIVENGDHAVVWRLSYRINSAYRLIEAEYLINRAAYDLSRQQGIGLNTPLTHSVENVPEHQPAHNG